MKETRLALRDPFGMFREMRNEIDRMFNMPASKWHAPAEPFAWSPTIDVFEKEGHLITKVDLPGVKKEDVKVEVTDGHLAISGERKREFEEKKENVFRSEREYGSFYRIVPLPEGVKIDDVKATFADGVLEVSVPVPAPPSAKVRTVEIGEPAKAAKTAA
jgi:HSP20 family protein